MKKALVVTFFVLTIGLAACGGSSENETVKKDNVEAEQEVGQSELGSAEAENMLETEEAVVENNSAKELYGYEEPAELGGTVTSLSFQLNGAYYQFPMPLSEFLKNGWQIPQTFQREEFMQPGECYEIALENESGAILYEVRIANITEEALQMADCLVNRMLITADQEHDLLLPEGISFGSTEDELKAVTEQGSIIQNGNYTTYIWDNEAWTDSISVWYHPEVGVEYFECNGFW